MLDEAMLQRIRAAVGGDPADRDVHGRVSVVPSAIERLAHLMGVMHDARLRVAVQGSGTWQHPDTPADVTVSLRGLDQVVSIDRAALTIATQAGVTMEQLRREALEHGLWLPIDAPGRPDRTIGSVLATATAGPLRHGFGGIRQQVRALNSVGGDGRRSHAAVTRSIGGPAETTAWQVGAFGGFGIIVDAVLQLRELPRADATWILVSDRDRLTGIARDLMSRQVTAAAVEVYSPALALEPDWVLGVRLIGSADEVGAATRIVADTGGLPWTELPPERQSQFWTATARGVTAAPVSIRLGVLPEGVDETIDLVIARLGEGLMSAGPASGSIRWSGDAGAHALDALRSELATREIPLTVERAPWGVRASVGHFGAYREAAGAPIVGLRDTVDPNRVIMTTLGAHHDQ